MSGKFTLPARWRLGRPLGSGGQAEVWLAQDQELGEWVAIKVFSPDLSETARERLRREVRWGRTLQHPGLVRLYELVESDGRLALVMEWLAGGSLVRRLEAGPLPVDEVVRIADEALVTLDYLHAQGVVHRDVKPSNLLLDLDGHIRLGDLGLARPLSGGLDLTRTNTTVGTPAFMSPEQLRGEKVTAASDLYSLGATLFQLLTGALPFEGSSHFEVASHNLASRARDPRALRPECPRWLARFVLRLLEKRPEDRWPNASAARLALQRRAGLTPPRAVRKIATVLVSAVVVAAGVAAAGRLVLKALWHPEAQKVEAAGKEIRGLNARGKTIWRVTLESPVRQVEQVDLDGDGSTETVVSAWPVSFQRSKAGSRSEVAIFDRKGDVLSRIVPEEFLSHWPFEYPASFDPILRAIGIGPNGGPALVVNCRHRIFYPTVLVVYWPQTGVWEPALYHSGWISDLAAVQGSDHPRLRFEGVNNRLCMYPVVGELMVGDPESSSVRQQRLVEDGESVAAPLAGKFSLAWYTPLDLQGPTHGALELAGNGDSVLTYPSGSVVVDRFGNAVPGPNAGRDLRGQRTDFLIDIVALDASAQPVSAVGVETRLEGLRTRYGDLLRERPYRAILATLGARALVRAGSLRKAIDMLRRARGDGDVPETTLRLAHLEALAGDLAGATRLAREVLDGEDANRRYDAGQLLRILSIEARDVDGVRAAAVALGYWEQSERTAAGITAALWVGTHLWWDEVGDTDTRCSSSAFVPAGDALACLARWRLGRTAAGDADAMTVSEEVNPDARFECRIARAAALLGQGHAVEAASLLNDVSAHLESISRDDFENRQSLELARAISVKALLGAGEREQAFRAAAALRPQLRPGLLPRILVEEVLSSSALDGR